MKLLLPPTVILLLASLAAGQEVTNPKYEAWKNFKEGAMVRFTGSTKTMGMETGIEIRRTLVSKSADKVVIDEETWISVGENKKNESRTRKEIAAKVAKELVPAAAGTESVTVAGKTFNCQFFDLIDSTDGLKMGVREWTTDQVPGGSVKIECRTEGSVASDTRLALQEYKE